MLERAAQLTLAVIDVDNRVAVLQALRNTTDEPLGALRRSVDSNQTEWTLGSRHDDDDDDVKCVGKTKKKQQLITATSRGVLFRKADCAATLPHTRQHPLLRVAKVYTSSAFSTVPPLEARSRNTTRIAIRLSRFPLFVE